MADYTVQQLTDILGGDFWVELNFDGCSYWHCLRVIGAVVPTPSNSYGYFLAFDMCVSEQYPSEYFWEHIKFMCPARSYKVGRTRNEKTPH